MQKHYDTPGAAKLLGLSPKTLERWRLEGGGPKYRKFGKRVMYAETDLSEWAEGQTRTSTSDTGQAA